MSPFDDIAAKLVEASPLWDSAPSSDLSANLKSDRLRKPKIPDKWYGISDQYPEIKEAVAGKPVDEVLSWLYVNPDQAEEITMLIGIGGYPAFGIRNLFTPEIENSVFYKIYARHLALQFGIDVESLRKYYPFTGILNQGFTVAINESALLSEADLVESEKMAIEARATIFSKADVVPSVLVAADVDVVESVVENVKTGPSVNLEDDFIPAASSSFQHPSSTLVLASVKTGASRIDLKTMHKFSDLIGSDSYYRSFIVRPSMYDVLRRRFRRLKKIEKYNLYAHLKKKGTKYLVRTRRDGILLKEIVASDWAHYGEALARNRKRRAARKRKSREIAHHGESQVEEVTEPSSPNYCPSSPSYQPLSPGMDVG